jgi:phospholipid/cholesterol/gamma-HCH transport system substrate-binding protein
VPSRKEIQWSQLKVGALVLVALAILVAIIFLMSGSTGGLFARKLVLRTYFINATGLKAGAPVTLEGVTIGNVTHIHIVPARNPTPVEVTMQVGQQYVRDLHTDSTTSIAQAGVLGDSFVDITSARASGPSPANNAELRSLNAPSIQEVVRTSEDALKQTTILMGKVNTFVDALNSTRGSAGKLINDPELYNKLTRVASNIETLTANINHGKGSLGKLMTDDAVYTKLSDTVDQLNTISASLAAGHGTAGKLIHDETLYNNLNSAVANTNKLLEGVNRGEGALGKLAKDPEFARKLDESITSLDVLLKGVTEGKGTLGELVANKSLYEHTDETMKQAADLVKAVRENPKKYLVIHLKIF